MSQYQPMYDTFQRDTRERYVPSSRISVSASVFLPASDIDMTTGQLKQDHVRRRRTQGKRLEAERLERESRKNQESLERELKKGGVRVTWISALVICASLVFGCLFTLDYQLSTLQGIQDQRNKIDADMAACEALYEELLDEFEIASSETKICYAAAQDLKMIPAEAAEAVYLVPVDTRPLVTASQNPQQIKADVMVQPTQIPTVASAGN